MNYCRYKGKYKKTNANLSKFKDSSKVSSYAQWGMKWAVGNKIINGSNGNLNPPRNSDKSRSSSNAK